MRITFLRRRNVSFVPELSRYKEVVRIKTVISSCTVNHLATLNVIALSVKILI